MASTTSYADNSSLQSKTVFYVNSTPTGNFTAQAKHVVTMSLIDTVGLTTVAFFIICANCLICWIFSRVRGLRKEPPNILLCNQACADLVNGFLFIPVRIVEGYVTELPVSPFILCYCLFLSLFSLCALAVDRYVAILRPLQYRQLFNDTVIRWEIGLIWLLPLIMTLVPLSYEFRLSIKQHKPRQIYTTVLWAFVLILFFAMIIMYLIVFWSAKRNITNRIRQLSTSVSEKYRIKAQLKLQKKELHIAVLFALFMVFFLITYFPILLINLFFILKKLHLIPKQLITASLYSFVTNSIINPVLCIMLKKDFKTGLRNLLIKTQENKGSSRIRTTSTSSKGKSPHSKTLSGAATIKHDVETFPLNPIKENRLTTNTFLSRPQSLEGRKAKPMEKSIVGTTLQVGEE